MNKTIEIIIELREDGSVAIDSNEPESGCNTGLLEADNPAEVKDYIVERVGNEIYSWIELMQDEMEEE